MKQKNTKNRQNNGEYKPRLVRSVFYCAISFMKTATLSGLSEICQILLLVLQRRHTAQRSDDHQLLWQVAPLQGWNAAATQVVPLQIYRSHLCPKRSSSCYYNSALESVRVCCLVWWRWVGGIRSAELSRASGQGVVVVVVGMSARRGAPSPE